jgi:hypothetical protein
VGGADTVKYCDILRMEEPTDAKNGEHNLFFFFQFIVFPVRYELNLYMLCRRK